MREIKGWENFKNYLLELPNKEEKEKPFACPKLIVLPEDVQYDSELFYKGSYLCHPRAFLSQGLASRCSIKSEIKFNEDGDLEVLCDGRICCGYFKIEIKGFKFKE